MKIFRINVIWILKYGLNGNFVRVWANLDILVSLKSGKFYSKKNIFFR